jgi:hypothetical protein
MKHTIKIHGVRVKGYDFTATVYIDDLPLELLDALRINPNNTDLCEVELQGEFSVNASKDDCEVDSLDSLYLVNGEHAVDVSQDERIDCSELKQEILEAADYGSGWYDDYLDSIGDAQYDAWKDSQFDT